MLILNRKKGYAVCVGEDIEVTVVNVKIDPHGNHIVELGFDAPSYVPVDRKEVRQRRLNHIDGVINGISTDPSNN